MARLPRIVVPGQALHIIQRGNNRQPIFFCDKDYHLYLGYLSDAARQYDCQIHAYVLMTNHVHLLLTPLHDMSPSRCMQSLGRKYVRYINSHYQRSGTLWEGRYKSALIDSERYLLCCYRYTPGHFLLLRNSPCIELNPVRAGMVNHPAEYPWSSYRCNALGQEDELIHPHDLYTQLSAEAVQRQTVYAELLSESLPAESIKMIRDNTNADTIVGNDKFKDEMARVLDRRVEKLSHGGDRKSVEFRRGQ